MSQDINQYPFGYYQMALTGQYCNLDSGRNYERPPELHVPSKFDFPAEQKLSADQIAEVKQVAKIGLAQELFDEFLTKWGKSEKEDGGKTYREVAIEQVKQNRVVSISEKDMEREILLKLEARYVRETPEAVRIERSQKNEETAASLIKSELPFWVHMPSELVRRAPYENFELPARPAARNMGGPEAKTAAKAELVPAA